MVLSAEDLELVVFQLGDIFDVFVPIRYQATLQPIPAHAAQLFGAEDYYSKSSVSQLSDGLLLSG